MQEPHLAEGGAHARHWRKLYWAEREKAALLAAQVAELERSRDQLQNYAEDLRRTYTELRWWLASLSALHEASTTITAALEEELVLQRVFEALAQLVPHDRAQVFLASEAGAVRRLAPANEAGESEATQRGIWPENEFGERLQESFTRRNELHHAASFVVLEHAALIAPLRAGGRGTGILALVRPASAPFTPQELRLVELLAAIAAVALENARLYQETQRLATVDPLTDLYNYRYFHQALALEVARAKRLDYPVAVLIADLDHFKQINDRHGHPKADELLREIARVACEQFRRTDVLARLGGEEFGVVLPGVSTEALEVVGEKLRLAVAAIRLPGGAAAEEVRVTISIGGVSLPAERAEPALLVNLADQALLRAKQAGRNRVVIAHA